MKKRFATYVKKAIAVGAMALAVIAVVPKVAEAGTAPTKGCSGNTSTGYHSYQFYCRGFDHIESPTHTYYKGIDNLFKKNPQICTYKVVYDIGSEHCEYCGGYTGVWALHHDTAYHQNCGQGNIDLGICTGLGSRVTVITQ